MIEIKIVNRRESSKLMKVNNNHVSDLNKFVRLKYWRDQPRKGNDKPSTICKHSKNNY